MSRLARAALAAIMTACPASAHVLRFEETACSPFPADFGGGAFVVIQGVAHGELDPADPRNAVIASLSLAPRNASGRVASRSEVTLLRPADLQRFNGRLVHEVTDRTLVPAETVLSGFPPIARLPPGRHPRGADDRLGIRGAD